MNLPPFSPELKKSEYDYELFFNLSPDLVCIAGFDGYFKRVNPAVQNLLEYSFDELYSRPINDFIHPDDRERTSIARENIHRSDSLLNFENRYVTKKGSVVWLEWTSEPVPDDRLVFAIAKNITYKKQLEAEQIRLIDELSTVNDELKQFNLTASHDLRSPLSSLMTIFDLLDVSKISDRETLELIEILKLSGIQLKDTLNRYVDRLSNKRVCEVNVEKVNLMQTLDSIIQAIPLLIRTSKTQIQSDFSELPEVTFNPAYLESIFMNLITNSIKYAGNGRSPVIKIRSEIENDTPKVFFEDNGRGFNMESVRGKIFGINQTFHKNFDSKGVGLYLVHKHITDMGGEISVESTENIGTRFVITFKEQH
ncbi:PAS domain-containing sensor histidine kinase [Rhodohalobacter sp. SW132]|uniref:PAS domain-containing sensor histidine kinase n=1 Tax=Rhodohalobacter sp. SW132 TaxID=2293433 RepID=UPI000E24A1EB|nr:PAS domain-containing sensor histidine kinase [Rhodohalobacter sp. SW132]REL24521.1 PAS domain-containing sensor histidine kinase [Rhodohalobacter sp. SW132]